MKDSEPDLARLDELAEQLDAGWDELDSMAPPPLSAASVSDDPPPSLEAVDEGWEGLDEAGSATPRPRRREKKKRATPARVVPERPIQAAPLRMLSKKQRRELERKQRAHGTKQRTERKAQRKLERREEARQAAEKERLAREQARAERALEEQRRNAEREARRAEKAPVSKPTKLRISTSEATPKPVAKKGKKASHSKAPPPKKDRTLYAVPFALVLAAIAIYFMTR